MSGSATQGGHNNMNKTQLRYLRCRYSVFPFVSASVTFEHCVKTQNCQIYYAFTPTDSAIVFIFSHNKHLHLE